MNQGTDDVVSLGSMPHSQINCQETAPSRSHRSTLAMYTLRLQIKFRSLFSSRMTELGSLEVRKVFS